MLAFLGVLLGRLLLLWACSSPFRDSGLFPSGTVVFQKHMSDHVLPLTKHPEVAPTACCVATGLLCCALDSSFTIGSSTLFSVSAMLSYLLGQGCASSLRDWSLHVPYAWNTVPTPSTLPAFKSQERAHVFSLGNGSLRPGLDQLPMEPLERLSFSNLSTRVALCMLSVSRRTQGLCL